MTAGPHDALASASLALARRFHRGATLWCWSPAWPPHAEHLAVEFVHPGSSASERDRALAGRIAGRPSGEIASDFHRRLAAGLARASIDIARRERLKTVALTGGVFQNALLTSLVEGAIVDAGLEVLVHRRVPPNDGGISIGQAAIAAATC